MNTKQKTRWWVDAALFAGFIIAFFLELTGVTLHQWIGMLVSALAAYHLIAHREWVRAVTQRFFGRTSGRARLYYLLNGMILIGFACMIGSGLVISTWLGLSLANYAAWRVIHILASIFTLLAVYVKLGLHGRWIALAARQALSQPVPVQHKPVLQTAIPAARGISRSEFLGVMGVVGLASLLALIPAAESLTNSPTAASSSSSDQAASQASITSYSNSSSSSGTSACAVQCGHGCSYPGHCRRYSDSNNNGLCDFGECL
jgi:hypothetical protein